MTVRPAHAYNSEANINYSEEPLYPLPPQYPTDTKPRVAIETHGCKLNQADSSRLVWQFIEAGFQSVPTDEPADVFVVNTCTVTHIADRKARQSLRAARRRNPDAIIVAAGCYPQRSPGELTGLEEVDLVVGNADKSTLVRQVTERRGEPPVPCATGADVEIRSTGITRTKAMVKIQEGCDQVCAYCIVPKVRGRERSIPPADIVSEIGQYVARGYKEVVLTGTQLGSYGFELPNIGLTRLLERILLGTDVVRLRISSLQPQDITPGMLGLWSDSRLCPHFHLPRQSGSDSILKHMRRRYTADTYVDAVEMIRRCIPGVSITADVIVGFPGETEREFEETYALCDQIGFADMHVFPYSIRPGTSAAHHKGQVDPEVKSRRSRMLLELAEKHSVGFRRQWLGTVRPVLWETPGKVGGSHTWSGLTDNYIRVSGTDSRNLANRVTLAKLSSEIEGKVNVRIGSGNLNRGISGIAA